MKLYRGHFPRTLFRIQARLPVALRDHASQSARGRSSYNLKLSPDDLVLPMPSSTTLFHTPNGLSLRPAGENMRRILDSFRGDPLIYRIQEATPIPEGLCVWHEQSDQYSLQVAREEGMPLDELNYLVTEFLKGLPTQTRQEFLDWYHDEDDQDN